MCVFETNDLTMYILILFSFVFDLWMRFFSLSSHKKKETELHAGNHILKAMTMENRTWQTLNINLYKHAFKIIGKRRHQTYFCSSTATWEWRKKTTSLIFVWFNTLHISKRIYYNAFFPISVTNDVKLERSKVNKKQSRIQKSAQQNLDAEKKE